MLLALLTSLVPGDVAAQARSAGGHPLDVAGLEVAEWEEYRADVVLAGRRFTLGGDFVRDLETHNMEETLATLGRPLLIFHSPVDNIVGIENAALLYQAARHPRVSSHSTTRITSCCGIATRTMSALCWPRGWSVTWNPCPSRRR